ncbi:DNA methyltransferase [Vibrio sp. HA2012]|uniref:DNA adenine methylase n=1 Tax=Vibrio sp. HA2012 TaxID=1971595 RepID=UPI000C2C5ADE|nr:DNA adenine methylase [Vibrio sp. HA2012]PJC85322.1 DNA methyltransferase [Vibrio sp. HA2012]
MSEVINAPAIRYHGGKFRLAPWIIEHFPEHKCYTECFGGAGNVLLRKPRSYAEVYNDVDLDVVNLFSVLRDPELNQKLREVCVLTPYSREEFELALEHTDEPLERARRTVVRATMGFAATTSASGFRIDTKRKYATAMHLWSLYPDNLSAVGKRFSTVLIENRPAIDVLKKHDAVDTLHYCDPPYMPETRVKGNRSYKHEMTIAEHEELLQCLRNLKGYVVLSGYESELYNDILTGWTKDTKQSRISGGRGTKKRTECLWVSPSCAEALAMHEVTA